MSSESRSRRQQAVATWVADTFGAPLLHDLRERASRLLEEAIEVAQAAGLDRDSAVRLVNHVFSKPPGRLRQEIGGVGVCLLALAESADLDADSEEKAEFARVSALTRQHFEARQQAKADAGVALAPVA